MEFKPHADELYLLVKSLSQAEKRYFRRYATLHSDKKGGQKYLLLFDAIIQMSAYNETALRIRCKGEKFLNQLPAARRHLMQLILRSLRLFHEGKSVDRRIRQVLDELDILYGRSLYKNCIRRIEKAKVVAQENDRLNLMLELLRWERRLLKKIGRGNLPDELKRLDKEEVDCQSRLENEMQLVRIHDIYLKSVPEETLVLPVATQFETFDARIARYNLLAIQAQRQELQKESQHHFKTCLEIWEDNPPQMNAHPIRYFGALKNYLASCHRACEYDGFEDQLKRIRNFAGVSSETAALIDPLVGNMELVYRLNQGQFNATLLVASALEQRLMARKTKGPALNRNIIEYNLAITYFLLDHPSESLRNLGEIIRRGRTFDHRSEYNLARLWELIVHHELGNADLFPSLLRSIKRHFQKYTPLPVIHSILIPKLTELQRKKWFQDRKEVYLRMYEELIVLPDQTGKTELLHWTKSRIEGIPIRDLLQKTAE